MSSITEWVFCEPIYDKMFMRNIIFYTHSAVALFVFIIYSRKRVPREI